MEGKASLRFGGLVLQDDSKDVSRVKQQQQRMPQESEVRQRPADCQPPPTMDSGDPRVSRVDSIQDGEVHDTTVVPEMKLWNLLRSPVPW